MKARRPSPWAERLLDIMDYSMENSMRWLGPVFVLGAVSLISLCAWAFVDAVFGEAYRDRTTSPQRWVHALLAAWVVPNLVFNYVMAILTPPGTTATLTREELDDAMPPPERWCHDCEKPKPSLSHHCSVCRRCVLQMDHHCPWINNCVGFGNYRYFFLFLFYMTVACGWACPVFVARYGYKLLPRSWDLPAASTFPQVRAANRFTSLLSLLLTACILVAVGGMLLWHAYLVATAQGTVDFQRNRAAAAEAASMGRPWRNMHDLGFKRNWQQRFDERGALWALTWAMPRLRPHSGDGFNFPIDRPRVALATLV